MPKATALSNRGGTQSHLQTLARLHPVPAPHHPARFLLSGEYILYLLAKQQILLLANAKYPSGFNKITLEVKLQR